MKCLGMPIDEKKLAVSQWDPIEKTFAKKDSWVGRKLAFHWDRVALVNACLSSISVYMVSFLEAPKGFIKKAELHRNMMVW
jgi:hypothetical protein